MARHRLALVVYFNKANQTMKLNGTCSAKLILLLGSLCQKDVKS